MADDYSAAQKRQSSSGAYNAPNDYAELGDITQQPIQRETPGETTKTTAQSATRAERYDPGTYDVPQDYSNLDETEPVPPLQELSPCPTQGQPRGHANFVRSNTPVEPEPIPQEAGQKKTSELLTSLYTHSYLVLFAILGVLARLGLTALTRYSGTPVIFNTIWANFSGSIVMGFLAEDRKLFRNEWGTPTYDEAIKRVKQKQKDEANGSGSSQQIDVDLDAAKRAHLATKKTIPLYIGMATGFCGSFTTFSSFIKDVFLALSNELKTPGWSESPTSRNGGYSFMAMLAVIITTVSLSLSVLLAIFPLHNAWRGQALFALIFGPLGCLLRFYLSLYLNGKMKTFPLGTFTANVFGTVILGMSWDLAHVPVGGVIGCQVLEGMEDGFCGCLTTISTWVAELSTLRRRSAWIYGTASVVTALVLMIAIMGGLRWSDGYSKLLCTV
ncbi:related to chromosome condensation protein (CrcB) [Fusarium mangiferae]|uniref:Related to chromosome condensation protein (CrcB) n=1 Tax=Fusarium mangiferae TaxID=192010 RepID=A0A1L7U9W8_FUSMA|nr:uncharacterized protein FMAN_12658 [Fusarium mangiferae]CVL04527.1 related to chromosome condensation protein (CrcB) [Fusarium mangiferae]